MGTSERKGFRRALLGGTIGLGVVLIAGALAAFGQVRASADPEAEVAARILPVTVMSVDRVESYTVERGYTGEIQARRTSLLGFERSGRIEEVLVEEGARVQTDEPLARLDTDRLHAQRLVLEARRARARADLDALTAGPRSFQIEGARAQVEELEHQVALWERKAERRRELLERKTIAPEVHDEAASQRDALAARLAAARQSLAELEAGTRTETLRAQRAFLSAIEGQIAEVDLELGLSVLKAPFAGTIGARLADEGTVTAPGAPVLRLVESGALEARIGLPAALARTLRPGARQRLVVGGREVSGSVSALLPELDGPTRTRTVLLEVAPDPAIAAGEVVRLRIAETVPAAGYWLPLSALQRSDHGLWSCYGLDPDAPGAETGRVVRHELEVIATDGDRALVRGTLTPSARVLHSGTHRVVVGQRVRAVDPGPGGADAVAPSIDVSSDIDQASIAAREG